MKTVTVTLEVEVEDADMSFDNSKRLMANGLRGLRSDTVGRPPRRAKFICVRACGWKEA